MMKVLDLWEDKIVLRKQWAKFFVSTLRGVNERSGLGCIENGNCIVLAGEGVNFNRKSNV